MTSAAHGQERSRVPPVLLFGVCVLLALINWQALNMEIDLSPAALQDADETVPLATIGKTISEPDQADAADFPQTVARPLFRSNRRPPQVEQPKAAARPRTPGPAPIAGFPDDIKLVGIIKESGKTERALVRTRSSPFAQHFQVGEVLNGWRLGRIEEKSVLFESNGREHRLSLFPQNEE